MATNNTPAPATPAASNMQKMGAATSVIPPQAWFYLIGVPSFCLSLTIILFAYDGRNRLVEDRMWKEGTPILQSVMVWFKQTANAASWFALPMLFHHFFVVPPGFASYAW